MCRRKHAYWTSIVNIYLHTSIQHCKTDMNFVHLGHKKESLTKKQVKAFRRKTWKPTW